jgi:gamma-tubulin complex component 3
MISHAKSSKGGALLSTMYKGVLHGGMIRARLIQVDPVVADFTRHLVGQVTKPFFMLIKRWVLEGVCDDAKGEFFIAIRHNVGKDDIWTHRESLEVEMIPSFIPETLARKV